LVVSDGVISKSIVGEEDNGEAGTIGRGGTRGEYDLAGILTSLAPAYGIATSRFSKKPCYGIYKVIHTQGIHTFPPRTTQLLFRIETRDLSSFSDFSGFCRYVHLPC
jgi:hypothetical protein